MEERPKVGIAAFVLKDDKVLLLKRKGAHGEGTWCFPGGHLEFNGSIFDAAIRETKEETHVDVENPRFLCITEDFFEKENKHYITIHVWLDYAGGELEIEQEKCTDIGWFDINDLPSPLFLPINNMLSNKCFPENWRSIVGVQK